MSKEHNRGQKFESVIYTHLQKKHNHIGFVKNKYDIDFTNGDTNRQVCRELNTDNRARESEFGNAPQQNILISRYNHTFTHPHITMLSWKDVLLEQDTI